MCCTHTMLSMFGAVCALCSTCTTIHVYHHGMCAVLAALCVPAHSWMYTEVYMTSAAGSPCHTPSMLYICCAGHALCCPCHVCYMHGSLCLVPRQHAEGQQTSVNTCAIIASNEKHDLKNTSNSSRYGGSATGQLESLLRAGWCSTMIMWRWK